MLVILILYLCIFFIGSVMKNSEIDTVQFKKHNSSFFIRFLKFE